MNTNKPSDSKSGFGRITLEQGPIEEVHAFWLAGMSCDGCSIAAVELRTRLLTNLFELLFQAYPESYFITLYFRSQLAMSSWKRTTRQRAESWELLT